MLKDSRAVYTPGLSEHAGSTSKFYHADALGSTRGITDATQATTDAVLYDAFGMTVSRTGSTATPFGFVGAQQYQTDADSGLQLLGHRYFDASVGRFISSDPAKAGTNWYAYCENAPLGSTDPTGYNPAVVGLTITGLIEAGPIGWAILAGVGIGLALSYKVPIPEKNPAPVARPVSAPEPEPGRPIGPSPIPLPDYNSPRNLDVGIS